MGELGRKMGRFIDDDVPDAALDEANNIVLKAIAELEAVRKNYNFKWRKR